jgi:GntR family transcriptional regulator
MIEAGEIGDGESLPSERALAEMLNLSRVTIRRAYDELRAKDYLETRAGWRHRKNPPRLTPRLDRLKGFTEEMRELGMEPSTRLLERSVVTDRTLASIFSRPSTATFLRLVRLRLGDGVPLSRGCVVRPHRSPALAEWDVQGSAYHFLAQRCGIALSHGEQTIEAILSSAAEAEVFDFSQPSLPAAETQDLQQGRPADRVRGGTFRGDAYAYRLTLKLD